MPLDSEGIDTLKSLLMAARKGPVNFGLCLASDPADTALVLHGTKSPDALLREAKRADGVQPAKSTFGTLEAQGKVVTPNCMEDPRRGRPSCCAAF